MLMKLHKFDNVYKVTAFFIIFLHFYLIFRYSVNAPNADDFDMLLAPLLDYINLENKIDYITSIFKKHGEHYVILHRLLPVFLYEATGKINFKLIVLLGNTSLLFILSLLSSLCLKNYRKQFIFTASAFLFNPMYAESSLWASGALQHMLVIPFILAAIVFYRKSYLLALSLSVLSTFIQGNGIFCFVALALLSFLEKKPLLTIINLILFISLLLLLHHNEAVRVTNVNIYEIAKYSLSFLGSAAPSYIMSTYLGLGIVFFFVYLCFNLKPSNTTTILVLLSVFILTALANAYSRISFGEDYAFTQLRYKLISLTCMSLISLYFFNLGSKKYVVYPPILALFVLAYSYYRYLPEYQVRYDFLSDSILRYKLSGDGLEYPYKERANMLMAVALKKNIFKLNLSEPPKYKDRKILNYISKDVSNPKLRKNIEYLIIKKDGLLISGYFFFKDNKKESYKVLFCFSTPKSLCIPADVRQRPDVVRHMKGEAPLNSGFFLFIKNNLLNVSKESIKMVIKDNDKIIYSKKLN
jgi:hypothetical protein